jgi:CheY-like chemotaxis protein
MTIRSILVVDDEPDIQTVAEMSLRAVGGWDVSLASSGAEALALAASLQPDLVLLDVMMPGLDGTTTLRMLRERPATAHIPVILMTAKVQRHEVARYLESGAAAVIPKPFDPMELPHLIRALTAGL